MAVPLSAGRMMMFAFCWRDFRDVDCFLVMFLSGGFALRMIELRSARMVSASSVVIPVNVVSVLAIKSIAGRAAYVPLVIFGFTWSKTDTDQGIS